MSHGIIENSLTMSSYDIVRLYKFDVLQGKYLGLLYRAFFYYYYFFFFLHL